MSQTKLETSCNKHSDFRVAPLPRRKVIDLDEATKFDRGRCVYMRALDGLKQLGIEGAELTNPIYWAYQEYVTPQLQKWLHRAYTALVASKVIPDDFCDLVRQDVAEMMQDIISPHTRDLVLSTVNKIPVGDLTYDQVIALACFVQELHEIDHVAGSASIEATGWSGKGMGPDIHGGREHVLALVQQRQTNSIVEVRYARTDDQAHSFFVDQVYLLLADWFDTQGELESQPAVA